MTKKLVIMMMALAMVFGFTTAATANYYDGYGVWEDSYPGKGDGTYEWTYGELLGGSHDYVKIERKMAWIWERAWYTFSMDDIGAPSPAFKVVNFEASWLRTQELFDDDNNDNFSISYITPDGYNVDVRHEEWLDIDNNGQIDGVIADFFIPEGCPEFEAIQIYDWTLGDGSEGDRWYIEYARMDIHCVPIPGAVWLLGSGLIGLVGIRRRKG